MKHNKAALYALCALAALGSAAAILLSGADIARVLLCYPLEFTGKALRSLSLAGGALNALAIALYAARAGYIHIAAISLVPAALALIFARKRGHAKADSILYILSIVLFAALYLAINPGLLRYVFSADMLTIVASYQVALGILNSLIYSLVLCYAVLRIISRLALDGTDRLLSAGAWLLYIACAVLSFASAYSAAAVGFGYAYHCAKLLAASLAYGALDISVSIVRAAVDTLPNVFSILLALCGAKLLLSMRGGMFSDEAVDTAQRLSRLAVISLKVSVISSAAFNAVQIALAGGLSNVNVSASIPFAGVLFALLALIFSRFIAESKRIKDDNDSII